jgi:hypothetical protein
MTDTSAETAPLAPQEQVIIDRYLSKAASVVDATKDLIDLSKSIRSRKISDAIVYGLRRMGLSQKYEHDYILQSYYEMFEFFSLPISHRVCNTEKAQAALGRGTSSSL